MEPNFNSTGVELTGKLNWPLANQPAKMLTDIAEFHTKFGFEAANPPATLSEEMVNFRIKFLQEELNEFEESYEESDLAGQFDALIDLVYVALGTAFLMGVPWQIGWDRVHKANMTKVRRPSDRSDKFDIVKPKGFVPPNLDDLVK